MFDSTRIEELKRRVRLDPASIAFAALAEEYRRAGQFEDAIAACKAGLLRHPAYLSARVTLGRAFLELGRFEDAGAEFECVLRSAPENLAAIRGLAELHRRRGEIPETVEHDPAAGQDIQRPLAAAAVSPSPPGPSTPPEGIAAGASKVTPPERADSPAEHEQPEERAASPMPPATPDDEPASLPPSLGRIPRESIELSSAQPLDAAAPASLPAESSAVEPVADVARRLPPPHPDAAALPALENLLAAVMRARGAVEPAERPGG